MQFKAKYLLALMCSSVLAAEPVVNDEDYHESVKKMCAANSEPIARTAGAKVFSWKDENGQVHFGDRPPMAVEASVETMQGKKDYFDMTVEFPSGGMDQNISDALQVNGRAIMVAMSRLMPADRLAKSHIDMKVFNSRRAFLAYRDQKAPGMSNNISGFYVPLDNAVAVWHSGDKKYAQQVALHEATHVFQFKNIGYMPGWLTEGMAEYFEMMDVHGSTKAVRVSETWMEYFDRKHKYIPLDKLLSAHLGYWQGSSATAYYGNSWAFVYFMMQSENRPIMAKFIEMVSRDKCDEMPDNQSVLFFEQNYPGGMKRLQKNWLAWLAGSHQVPNYH